MISVEDFLATHGQRIPDQEEALAGAIRPDSSVSEGSRGTRGLAYGSARALTPTGEWDASDEPSKESAGLADEEYSEGTSEVAEPTLARATSAQTKRATRKSWQSGRGAGASVPEDPKDLDACREAALRLLDAAPRASGALRERLLDKGYDVAVVDEVIERLIRVQLLDDRAYAESAVRWCAGRLLGRRGTVMELTRKGVDRSLAEQVAAEADEQGVFEDAVWELGRQVARKTKGLDREVRRRRLWSAGGRKGHSPDALRRVAQDLL